MTTGLLVALAVLVAASTVWAGVPCRGTSEVWAETYTACVGEEIEIYVIVRDCYGVPLSSRVCIFYTDRPCIDRVIGNPQTTDGVGFAQASMKSFSAGESRIYVMCEGVVLGPSPAVTFVGSTPMLRAKNWINPQPWRKWIGGAGDTTQLEFHVCDTQGHFDSVQFYYDTGGGWMYVGSDDDGTSGCGYDGWSAYLDHDDVPQVDQDISLISVAWHDTCALEYAVQRVYDPTPPSDVGFSIYDWYAVPTETLYLYLFENGVTVDSVFIDFLEKDSTFVKGIPELDPSTDAFPAGCYAAKATAACFKYFEQAYGDTHLTGNLDDYALVDQLCYEYMNYCTGTAPTLARWVNGVRSWIDDHCHGYTIQDFEHKLPYDCNPWKYETFQYIRNEFEECENVLQVFWWGADVWRVLTWHSIVNDSLPSGRYLCEWYDPATNTYESGELDPWTGMVYFFTGPNGDTPWICKTLIISPNWADWHEPVPPGEHARLIDYVGSPIEIPMPFPPYAGNWWIIRIIVKDTDGNVHMFKYIIIWAPPAGVEDRHGDLPKMFNLGKSTPNPFSVSTEIQYAVPVDAKVSIDIYDVLGKKVRTLVSGAVPSGYHTAVWDGRDNGQQPVAPGIYYARMVTDKYTESLKLMYLK